MNLSAAALFIFAFTIYLLTLYPNVPGGDSGELITAAYRMTVAHPPGYPLYTLLAKLFTFIPHGSIAWRVNLLSAFCDSLAAAVLLLSVTRWSKNLFSGWIAGGLFAFSPLIWEYAVGAEVFALNNLICALLFYCAIRFSESLESKFAYFFALFLGLGLCHHYTFIFFALFFGIPIFRRVSFSKRKALLLIFLGYSPVLYLFLAGTQRSTFSWGHTADIPNLISHLLRSEYGSFRLGAISKGTDTHFIEGMYAYAISLFKNSLYLGPFAALYGIIQQFKNTKKDSLLAWSIIAYTGYLIFFHAFSNLDPADPLTLGVISRFWQMPSLIFFAWVGLGTSSFFKEIKGQKIQKLTPLFMTGTLIAAQIYVHYTPCNQSKNSIVSDYGKAILTPLPLNALVMTEGDLNEHVLKYLQYCENLRTDVYVISQQLINAPWYNDAIAAEFPDIILPGRRHSEGIENGFVQEGLSDEQKKAKPYSLRNFLELNAPLHLLYNVGGIQPGDITSIDAHFATYPLGISHFLVPKADEPNLDLPLLLKQGQEALLLFSPMTTHPPSPTSWEYWAMSEYQKAVKQTQLFKVFVTK